MKRFSFLILIISLLYGTSAFAQRKADLPVAKPVKQGVWLYLGNTLPKDMTYQIERKSGAGFEKLATVTLAASQADLAKRQKELSPHFNAIDPLNEAEIKVLWDFIQKNSRTDSLYSHNMPVMHLLAGTAYHDKTALANTGYVYRVSLLDKGGNVLLQNESNNSESLRQVKLPTITFSEKEYADGRLSITWIADELYDMAHFNIYRTVHGKNNFQRMDGRSIGKGAYESGKGIHLIIVDSIGKSPAMYEYQIAAVDAFGNEGAMQAYARGGNLENFYSPPITRFKAESLQQNNEVKLSWQFENKKYLSGVDIMRSNNYDDGYIRIATLQVSDTTYIDILPETGENYYYYLLIQSAEMDIPPSAKVFVAYTGNTETPEPPHEVDAVSIPGGVTIYWKSEEIAARGFYVYRRNNSNHDFRQVSPIIPLGSEIYHYNDTSAALMGGEVYEYMLRTIAQDEQISENSKSVFATPGIGVKLNVPLNLSYRLDGDKVSLLWGDMTRWDNDLLGYRVWRKSSTADWLELENDNMQPRKNFYDDTGLEPKQTYVYAVSSRDIFGNESDKAEIEVVPVLKSELPSPPGGIKLEQGEEGVYLSWGQIEGELSALKIYRSQSGKKVELIGEVTLEDEFFVDKNIVKGALYFYQLSTVDMNKNESMLSDKVSLRVK